MELRYRTVALYGRFSPGVRDQLVGEIESRSGQVVRDLIHRADILVVGARADSLIESGALPLRLATAVKKRKRIYSEAAFQRQLGSPAANSSPAFPLVTALTTSGATAELAQLLAAFDVISLAKDACAFGDVATLKTACALRDQGCTLAQTVRTIRDTQRVSPKGRHKVVLDAVGAPTLEWANGMTTLAGQGLLPFDSDVGTIDDLFEDAVLAEAAGKLAEAARLFDACARADRRDAIALYNLGNIHLRERSWSAAVLAYRRALARDRVLLEAHYNLSHALEELGEIDAAVHECRTVLTMDRRHADATFNLAQLLMKQGQLFFARQLFEKYLTLNPPADWSAKARRAMSYCASCLNTSLVGAQPS